MLDAIRRALTRFGEFTTHPTAFAVVVVYSFAWLLFSPETFGWAAVASLATWLMTLFINRTGYRDTQALHASLMSFFVPTAKPEPSSRPGAREST